MTHTAAKILAHLVRLNITILTDTPFITIRRTHAGMWQRAEGAWSWFVYVPDDIHNPVSGNVGSQWPASTIARCKHVTMHTDSVGCTHLYPCDGCVAK